MATHLRNTPVRVDHAGDSQITIWQSYYTLCLGARTPTCAAAILDLLERKTASGAIWVELTDEDIHRSLFESFWLTVIKANLRWLIDAGYVQSTHDPNDEYGLHAYRFNAEVVKHAIALITNDGDWRKGGFIEERLKS